MRFEMDNCLLIISVDIEYNGDTRNFGNVLLNTGCSSTILDTDLCEELGLLLDLAKETIRKMYGIGGTEICIKQKVSGMMIDKFPFAKSLTLVEKM